MEAERTISPPGPSEGHACIGCGQPVAETRCGHCGVAVSPGGWTLVRQLASGPHSRVFLAEKNGTQAALKELVFALVPDAALLEGFEREARLLAQLQHPAIPRFVESFAEGKGVHTRLYLAQEFVRGTSLLDALKGHRFDEAEGKALVRSLLEVLEYLHGLSPRVIHRDVKPANVMRRPDGTLALVDFGAARDLVRGVTHGSTLVGTFGYMPPEQLGGTVDLTSDLYALGATVLHLLSRKPPDELLKPGMELQFDDEVNVSSGFRGWLKKLVEKDRRDRFQTARAAKDALDALDRPTPVKEAPRRDARPVSDRPWVLIGGLLTLAMAMAGTGIFFAFLAAPPEAAKPPAITQMSTTLPKPRVEPIQPMKPVVAAAPQTHAQVTTVPKAKVTPFTLTQAFTVPVGVKVPVDANGCSGSTFEVTSIGGEPGPPAQLALATALENTAATGACTNVYVEVLDAAGGRDITRSALLSNAKPGTTTTRTLKLTLPENARKVQVRFGPQGKPYAAFDVDLAKGTATQR